LPPTITSITGRVVLPDDAALTVGVMVFVLAAEIGGVAIRPTDDRQSTKPPMAAAGPASNPANGSKTA